MASLNDWVLIHIANDGSLLHPMHLHGYHFQVVGEDGFPLARQNRYMADTLVVAPGSRYDIKVQATEPAPGRSTATSFPTWKALRACSGW